MHLGLHFDLRAPSIGPPPVELYAAALEQCEWADRMGFDDVVLSCHHGCEDNYGPSQIVSGAAIAGRTRRMRIIPVVALPLYHPLHVAEDVAVLDVISGGRAALVVAAGYRESEFAMFGAAMSQRAPLMDEGLEALAAAWTGEPFMFRGERVLVTPRPVQRPRPTLIVAGYTQAAARRAARLGDDFMPMTGSDAFEFYREALREQGKPVPPRRASNPYMFLQVVEDPDRAWARLAPHLAHVTNSYAQWMTEAGTTQTYTAANDVDALKASGNFRIVTPEECIQLARANGQLMLDPLFGGIDPNLAWESLELFERRVLPALEVTDRNGAPG
jgi:alkanesulfonate monooxygenase SsuD/methylene tetrahydromethanopterin reductase-like flavin-dependent oxidoreductase (luciferase family)